MKSLVYLHYRLIANSILYSLRTPRRLIPVILFVLWIGQSAMFSLILLLNPPPWGKYVHISVSSLDQLWSACFLTLTVIVVTLVYNSLRDGLLIFAVPHIDFLFPAPISRRSVLVMKIMGDYAKYAAYAGFAAMVSLQGYVVLGMKASSALFGCLGAVLLLTFVTNVTHTLNLLTAYGLFHLQLAARAVKFGLIVIVLVILTSALSQYLVTGDAGASLTEAGKNVLARVVFAPVVWCTNLVLGETPGMDHRPGRELLWLFMLSAGSLIVLLRRSENFYEPSLAVSAREARIRTAVQAGDWSSVRIEKRRDGPGASAAGIGVPPFGRGAVAVFWKYLVVQYRRMGWSTLGIFLLPPITAIAARTLIQSQEVLQQSPLAMLYVVWGFILTGQQDIRNELKQADVIKAMPIKGFKIVLAEVLGQWMQLVLFTTVAAISIRTLIPEADVRTLTLVIAGSITLSISSIAASAIAVLLYPDSRDRFQHLVPAFVGTILIGLTALPSLGVVTILLFAHQSVASMVISLVVINALLAWLLLSVAGRLFDALDPTAR